MWGCLKYIIEATVHIISISNPKKLDIISTPNIFVSLVLICSLAKYNISIKKLNGNASIGK